jgi:hypothetical protein
MRLWHLLIGICFATPVGGALGSAKAAGAPTRGYVLAVGIGIVVGASFSWMMWRMHKAIVQILLRRSNGPQPLSEWYGFAFYVSKLLWITMALLFAIWLSSLTL